MYLNIYKNISKYNVHSHVSGIMLLGIPNEVFIYGTQYLSAGVINILVVIIIIYIFMPVFYELQLTSVYEVCIVFAWFWAHRYTYTFHVQF